MSLALSRSYRPGPLFLFGDIYITCAAACSGQRPVAVPRMGDAQSAQRENKKDAAAEEESGQVDDARAEQNAEDKVSACFPHIMVHWLH